MPDSTTISDPRGAAWLTVSADSLWGEGVVSPRLVMDLEARAAISESTIGIEFLRVQLRFANEYLGEGVAVGGYAGGHGNSLQVAVPVSREALDFVSHRIVGDAVEFEADLAGVIRMESAPSHLDAPAAGGSLNFGRSRVRLHIRVPRSDWFTRVLQPMRHGEYVLMEASLPSGPKRKEWTSALARLNDAEAAYAAGSDPAVFGACRAALEALPGFPKRIADSVSNERKRGALDDVYKYLGGFLHLGRHVDQETHSRGEFPVDHLDAQLALGLTKLLIAYGTRRFTTD